jgi:hypothetical protein
VKVILKPDRVTARKTPDVGFPSHVWLLAGEHLETARREAADLRRSGYRVRTKKVEIRVAGVACPAVTLAVYE